MEKRGTIAGGRQSLEGRLGHGTGKLRIKEKERRKRKASDETKFEMKDFLTRQTDMKPNLCILYGKKCYIAAIFPTRGGMHGTAMAVAKKT